MLIKVESLQGIYDCFSGQEEFDQFLVEMAVMIDEVHYTGQKAARNKHDEQFAMALVLKQCFLFTLFCKDHIELIRQMMPHIEYEVVDGKRKKQILLENPNIKDGE